MSWSKPPSSPVRTIVLLYRSLVFDRGYRRRSTEEHMKYALLIYDLPGTYDRLPDDEREAVFGEYAAISDAPGVYGGAWLQPVETATTLRIDGAEPVPTDGPFADTKEFLGGFYLLEADDQDAALE